MKNKLHHYFEDALQFSGEKVYLRSASTGLTYKQVSEMATGMLDVIKTGIIPGDRIVIYSSKNASSIAMMIACSKSDCIYVPVSSANPAPRANYIINETSAKFVLAEKNLSDELVKEGFPGKLVRSFGEVNLYSVGHANQAAPTTDDAAFILFTSGSTGTPKGVVVSHRAAIAFIDWAAVQFVITNNDTLASIAPFNFDLSVFDIYVSAKMKATLKLYSEEECKNALLMAQNLSIDEVTTIYATPTFYSALAHYGKLHKYGYSKLKNVLFAGEVFQFENFKVLLEKWPDKKYANLYGPTETNVCTFYKVDVNAVNGTFPIGKNCEYAILLLMDENGNEIISDNTEGELLVAGSSLFNEYWNDPEKTNSSTCIIKQQRFYKTGDIVFRNDEGNYVFVGRRDRMIKKNGYRIEPGEVEGVIMSLPHISNAVVSFVRETNQLICFIESNENNRPDFAELKSMCLRFLPGYMVPDKFVFLETMPKTTSGKIDLQSLEKLIK